MLFTYSHNVALSELWQINNINGPEADEKAPHQKGIEVKLEVGSEGCAEK